MCGTRQQFSPSHRLRNTCDPCAQAGAHLGGFLSGVLIAAIITTIYPTPYAYERSRRKDCI